MSDDMRLTPDEIEEIDALHASMHGAERSLIVALNFHANRLSTLRDDERRFWAKLAGRLDIDEQDGWKIERRRGHVRVVALSDEESEARG